MATSKIQVTEGSGKNLATNSFTEDTVTKEASRVVLNDSSGSEITTLPVSAAALPLPTGASTSALQTSSEAILTTIDTDTGVIAGDTTSIDGKITACNTGAVVVASGDITETNSAAILSDTASIDGKITACNTGAVVLAAGTAEIGKLAAGSAEIGNVTNSGTFAVQNTPAATAVDANWFQATITSADATTATQVKAKTAAKKIHVTSLIISTDTAMNIQLQSDNGTPQVVMEQIYLAANGGMALTFPERFPLTVNTNEDLDVIASASGNISVTVTGYVV
jgi:hypothetical protein